MRLATITRIGVETPHDPPPSMPALHVPDIGLPDATHRGTPLAKLPGPPEQGSDRATRDLELVHRIVAQRTHEGDVWARELDVQGPTVVWHSLASRVAGDPAVTQALLGKALAAASTQGGVGKRRWARQRPFQVDPTITVIGRVPKDVDSSHPSVHSARAYAAARIIATLDPKLVDEAYAMAREVAISRIYAGVHFPSDVVAGARLGTSLAEGVLARWRNGGLQVA